MDLKQLIKIIKAKTGLRQADIAEELKIERETLSRKISNNDPAIFNLLAVLYKPYLFDVEIPPSPESSEEVLLLSASVRMLNEEVAILKAKNEKISYDSALQSMKEKANSILRDLF